MSSPYALRRHKLRTLFAGHDVDAMLITDLINVRYLTGFTGSNAALLVTEDDESTVIGTDGRYVSQVADQVPDLRAHIDRGTDVAVAKLAQGQRLGAESHHVTVEQWDRLAAHATLTRAPGLVEQLREVKDETEIAALRAACTAADEALTDLLERGGLRPGRTEKEVARELEALMVDRGASGPSFETIVATGVHSAIPHHRPTDAVLTSGDFVKIDFGALVAGYHSDMTRTFVLGTPAAWQVEIYELVAHAQTAGRKALTPGVSLGDVDAAGRDIITEAGYGELFLHGTGHGVGLEIHEAPGIGAAATGTLLPGAVVTVEPGVYLSGRGGVRIEDTLVARESGPELLTLFTKDLTAV